MSSASRSPFTRPSFQSPAAKAHSRPPLGPFPQPQSLPACFYESFCERHALSFADYEEAMMARCLYPHARALRPLIKLVAPGYFTPDLDFIRSVGVLRNRREFRHEVEDFVTSLERARFWREVLRLRVSVDRVRHELEASWG